jgi:hypothetical protein
MRRLIDLLTGETACTLTVMAVLLMAGTALGAHLQLDRTTSAVLLAAAIVGSIWWEIAWRIDQRRHERLRAARVAAMTQWWIDNTRRPDDPERDELERRIASEEDE